MISEIKKMELLNYVCGKLEKLIKEENFGPIIYNVRGVVKCVVLSLMWYTQANENKLKDLTSRLMVPLRAVGYIFDCTPAS